MGALLALLSFGCVTPLKPLARVRVAVDNAKLSQLGNVIAIHLDLAIVNANHHSVSLSAIDWEIELDDRTVARGRLDFIRTIPAREPVTLRVSDRMRRGASTRYGAALLAKGAVVRVSGVLHFIGARADTATNFSRVTSSCVAR